jgi:hypothetical protein
MQTIPQNLIKKLLGISSEILDKVGHVHNPHITLSHQQEALRDLFLGQKKACLPISPSARLTASLGMTLSLVLFQCLADHTGSRK